MIQALAEEGVVAETAPEGVASDAARVETAADAESEAWFRPEYVKRQIDLIQDGLTQVLFDDYSVVINTDSGDPIWGNLAMHINVAINAARNAIARAEKSEALAEMRLSLEQKNQELERAVEALQRRNAELDAFVYTCSHDLRTPLVAMQGMVGLIQEEYGSQLEGKGEHYLGRLQANALLLERLIADLQQVGLAGRDGRRPDVAELGEIVRRVVTAMSEVFQAKKIQVELGELHVVHGVGDHVEQVVRSLIENAISYMGDGPEPRIEIGSTLHDFHVECWVRDNGIGIDPAYHDKIFEMFQRLNDVDVDGRGIGLAIVKKIVEGVGGRVWVESARGQGATFRFTWPRP
jgi:light-regulated signal transduction histidine kinase (bacteriophytochrome)